MVNPHRHTKIHGYVSEVTGTRWWAVLRVDGHDLNADMRDPLPPDRGLGSLFTIHRTRRGHTYLYWPDRRWTRSDLKRIRRETRALAQSLGIPPATGTPTPPP